VDSGAEANRALGLSAVVAPAGPSPASDSNVRLAQYTQQTKFVNGRNFFQNGQQWVDAGVQNVSQARRVRIQFSSPDYFALAAREPGALPWLALGQNVQFVLNGTVYDIYQ
jgi:hypothetical protein